MSRSFASSFLSLCILFSFLACGARAFNITTILNQYPDFSSFNSYLTQTQLAANINGRQTITVLAVENGNLGAIDGQPADFIKKIMSIHVVLDYYDDSKLQKMSNKSSLFTTLYQSSGLARNGEGFVNCTLENKQVAFGSGVPGSPINSKLVKTVASQPYNISVLQVSSLIVPPAGSSGSSNSSAKNSTTPAPPASAPKSAPAPSNSSSEAPAPSKGGDADAPTPSDASSPTADTPSADAPNASPLGPESDSPSSDVPDADAPTSDDGSGAYAINAGIGISLIVMGLSFALA